MKWEMVHNGKGPSGGPCVERARLPEGWIYRAGEYDFFLETNGSATVFVPATEGSPLGWVGWEWFGNFRRAPLGAVTLYWSWESTSSPSLLAVPADGVLQ